MFVADFFVVVSQIFSAPCEKYSLPVWEESRSSSQVLGENLNAHCRKKSVGSVNCIALFNCGCGEALRCCFCNYILL